MNPLEQPLTSKIPWVRIGIGAVVILAFLGASAARSMGYFIHDIYWIQEELGGDKATHVLMGMSFALAISLIFPPRKRLWRFALISLLAGTILTLEELNQLRVATRDFSWADYRASMQGLGLGLMILILFSYASPATKAKDGLLRILNRLNENIRNDLETGIRLFALRDGLVALAAMGGWLLGPDGRIGQILTGLLTGVVAYNLHEWGHFLGALWGKAQIRSASAIWSPFLFSFDSKTNSKKAFWTMTWPGFAMTALYLDLFWFYLPQDQLAGRLALGIAILLATLTVIIEFPLALIALIRSDLPPVEIPGFKDPQQ